MLDKLLDPSRRDEVVAEYKAKGRGGERYGVSCPRCYLRVAPQGYWLAKENEGRYCLCEASYEDEHESISKILEAHGLDPYRPLNVQPNMHEATRRKKRAKSNRND